MRIVTVYDTETRTSEVFEFTHMVMVGANGEDGVSEVSTSKSGHIDRALLASGVALHCAARPDPAGELSAVSRLAGRITNFEARLAGGAR